jgi:hypothetical protein
MWCKGNERKLKLQQINSPYCAMRTEKNTMATQTEGKIQQDEFWTLPSL